MGKENLFVTVIIPGIIAISLTLFQTYNEDYPLIAVFALLGIILFILMITRGIRFLQDREKRWKTNWKKHHDQKLKIDILENELIQLKKDLKINEKINKLEKNIKYLEGKNDI